MNLHVEQRGDVHILSPRKDLTGSQETDELDQVVQQIVAQGMHRIVIDLGHISFISSGGLGAMIRALVSCRKREGWLRVARVGERIRNLFLITRLTFVFETFDSVEEALQGINRKEWGEKPIHS